MTLALRELRERVRRLTCALFGHHVYREDRGTPVADFVLCRRCGRWWQ